MIQYNCISRYPLYVFYTWSVTCWFVCLHGTLKGHENIWYRILASFMLDILSARFHYSLCSTQHEHTWYIVWWANVLCNESVSTFVPTVEKINLLLVVQLRRQPPSLRACLPLHYRQQCRHQPASHPHWPVYMAMIGHLAPPVQLSGAVDLPVCQPGRWVDQVVCLPPQAQPASLHGLLVALVVLLLSSPQADQTVFPPANLPACHKEGPSFLSRRWTRLCSLYFKWVVDLKITQGRHGCGNCDLLSS